MWLWLLLAAVLLVLALVGAARREHARAAEADTEFASFDHPSLPRRRSGGTPPCPAHGWDCLNRDFGHALPGEAPITRDDQEGDR